jgi:hypothetical protein
MPPAEKPQLPGPVFLLERTFVFLLGSFVLIGLFRYGHSTGFRFEGVLKLVNENWKGALIISGLLFVRTIQEILLRIDRFKTPLGEIPALPEVKSVQPDEPARISNIRRETLQ